MKRKLFYGLLLTSLMVQGQIELRTELGDVYYSKNLYQTEYGSPEGSPYLNEDFTPAKINNINETKFVRFDAFQDRVEILVDENRVVILPENSKYTISLLDGSEKVYETINHSNDKGNPKYSFFELIANKEHFRLYLKEKIGYSKAEKAQGYQEATPPMFKKQNSTFYITDFLGYSDKLVEIPKKNKNFLKLFQEQSKSIKKFVNDNKLKIDNSDDLLKIFEFYFNN